MKIRIRLKKWGNSSFFSFWKCKTIGDIYRNPASTVQQHLSTTYSVGFVIVVVEFKCKFIIIK